MGARKSIKELESRVRERQVMEFRKGGASFTEIGSILNITEQGVGKIYKRAVNRIIKVTDESSEEVRWQELDRLDALLAAHWPFAEKGDFKSSTIVLRISERRSALLGLDAPKRVEVEDVTDIDKQIDKFLERARHQGTVPGSQVPVAVASGRTPRTIDAPRDNVVELVNQCG